MNIDDIKRKNIILIEYLKTIITDYKVVAEYKTNNNTEKVIVVQEQTGQKVVFYGSCSPIYNYYSIEIFGSSIQEAKELSIIIGNLIGQSVRHNTVYTDSNEDVYDEKWQIIFKQFSNPQPTEYLDIRRVGYSAILHCIVNKFYSNKREE